MAPDDSVEKVATLADYPLADLVHAGYQLLARNRGKEPGAQLLIGNGVIKDDPAKGPQGRQRNLDAARRRGSASSRNRVIDDFRTWWNRARW